MRTSVVCAVIAVFVLYAVIGVDGHKRKQEKNGRKKTVYGEVQVGTNNRENGEGLIEHDEDLGFEGHHSEEEDCEGGRCAKKANDKQHKRRKDSPDYLKKNKKERINKKKVESQRKGKGRMNKEQRRKQKEMKERTKSKADRKQRRKEKAEKLTIVDVGRKEQKQWRNKKMKCQTTADCTPGLKCFYKERRNKNKPTKRFGFCVDPALNKLKGLYDETAPEAPSPSKVPFPSKAPIPPVVPDSEKFPEEKIPKIVNPSKEPETEDAPPEDDFKENPSANINTETVDKPDVIPIDPQEEQKVDKM